jgi:hypothetical protein
MNMIAIVLVQIAMNALVIASLRNSQLSRKHLLACLIGSIALGLCLGCLLTMLKCSDQLDPTLVAHGFPLRAMYVQENPDGQFRDFFSADSGLHMALNFMLGLTIPPAVLGAVLGLKTK